MKPRSTRLAKALGLCETFLHIEQSHICKFQIGSPRSGLWGILGPAMLWLFQRFYKWTKGQFHALHSFTPKIILLCNDWDIFVTLCPIDLVDLSTQNRSVAPKNKMIVNLQHPCNIYALIDNFLMCKPKTLRHPGPPHPICTLKVGCGTNIPDKTQHPAHSVTTKISSNL